MKNVIVFITILCVLRENVLAQEVLLPISLLCDDVRNSPFTEIRTIDNRIDTQLLGYVHKGISNKFTRVKYEGDLVDTLGLFFKNPSPKSQGGGKVLVLMLNELFMHESETGPGKLKLSVRLFTESKPGRFMEFLAIDSIYRARGLDVTRNLLGTVDEELCKISKMASSHDFNIVDRKPDYSLDDLYHLDSLEKQHIPMFVTDRPVSGIYKDYAHFKMNDPDIKTEMVIDTTNPKKVKVYRIYKMKNRKIKFEDFTVYAVSDGQSVFKVVSSGDYFEIKKNGLGLYYDRKGSYSALKSDIPYYYPGGGAIGGAIAGGIIALGAGGDDSRISTHVYRFFINHRRGNSVPSAIVGD